MKTKIITLLPASAADDLHCKDGELENANYMFDTDTDTPGAAGEDLSMTLRDTILLPSSAAWLAMHRPPGREKSHAIAQLADGHLAFNDPDAPAIPFQPWTYISPEPTEIVRNAIASGDWLVFLTDRELLYARWNGAGYDWIGAAPGAPELTAAAATPRPLPPYSNAAGEQPQLTVTAPIGDDDPKAALDWLAGSPASLSSKTRLTIIEAVRTEFRQFLNAVTAAGLHYTPCLVRATWQLPDGNCWQASESRRVGETGKITLAIKASDCRDGMVYLTLAISRSPYAITAETSQLPAKLNAMLADAGVQLTPAMQTAGSMAGVNPGSISTPIWIDGTTRGFEIPATAIAEAEFRPFPAVLVSTDHHGLPADIFSAGQRLLAIDQDRRHLLPSLQTAPFIAATSDPDSAACPPDTFHIAGALRSAAAGDGLPSLYAFAPDGVHYLSPGKTGYSDTHLICRHVAAGRNSFAPMPDATAFVCKAGVMKISGTAATPLTKGIEREFDETDRLMYLYKENALLLYRPGDDDCLLLTLTDGKHHRLKSWQGTRHYAWPETWTIQDDRIGRPEILFGPALQPLTEGAGTAERRLIPITTRPIKLTDAFEIKQIKEVRTQWPDGSRLPVKTYGALRLGKWRFLGLARAGEMISRGSGWRFFRFETFAIYDGTRHLLPQIFVKFAPQKTA